MNCKNCKKQGCSLSGKDHEMSFECKAYIGKTNADRLRSMTDEELAEMMSPNDSGCPPIMRGGTSCLGQISCGECWLDWLKEEVSTNGN